MDTAPPDPGSAPPPAAKKYALSDYVFQFITITAGVLIALLVNGLVEVRNNQALVRDARATIAQEVAENKREVEMGVAARPRRLTNLEGALALVNQLLANDRPKSASMDLTYEMADLNSAAWDTAARTGALANMPYAEVERYSEMYAHQERLATHQSRTLEQTTAALAILADGDPLTAKPADLERFRQLLLLMRAGMLVEEQLATRVLEDFSKALPPF